MKINIDFTQVKDKPYVLVCIVRGKKDRITYNSGLIYFKDSKSVNEFREGIGNTNKGIEIYSVDVLNATSPPTDKEKKGYWCPYCQSWEYWIKQEGTMNCPICGISDSEHYVRKFNNLWTSGMRSAGAKKKLDNIGKKKRRKNK